MREGGGAHPAKSARSQDPVSPVGTQADSEVIRLQLPRAVLDAIKHCLHTLPRDLLCRPSVRALIFPLVREHLMQLPASGMDLHCTPGVCESYCRACHSLWPPASRGDQAFGNAWSGSNAVMASLVHGHVVVNASDISHKVVDLHTYHQWTICHVTSP